MANNNKYITKRIIQFNELLNRRVYSIGQLLYNVKLNDTVNVDRAINALANIDFDQMTVPAIGQVYDIDR